MRGLLRNIFALCILCFLASCQKDKLVLHTARVAANTAYDLDNVFFVNDSVGYICGGQRYDIGIILKTTDGGRTWSIPDSILPKALYTMFFFSAQEGLISGFDGYLAYTDDSAVTFSTSQFNTLPLQQLSFIDRQKGIAACGGGYRSGKVYRTDNGGTNWSLSYIDSMHAFNGAAYIDDSSVVICGYGTILHSHDSGVTFEVVKENGDIYQAMKFIGNIGYAVGYQGEVIKSTDGGIHWQMIRHGNGVFSSADHLMGVDFIDESNGYAVGESGLMIHTSDGGQSWQKVKPFTGVRLRGVHMFSATSGIVVGSGGEAYLFQE